MLIPAFKGARWSSPPALTQRDTTQPTPAREQVDLSKAASEKKSTSTWRKVGLGSLAALGLVGSVGAAAGYATQHLPLCEFETSHLAIQDGTLCVTPDLSKNTEGLYRGTRGLLHRGQAISDLSGSENQTLSPDQPSDVAMDGKFRVMTWNIHHGVSQDRDGARPQLQEQIELIRKTNADVDLLQEVNPWHAQKLVEGTNKIGVYSQTNGRQGNLMLVSPELEIVEQARLTLNHDTTTRSNAEDVVDGRAEQEPRSAQFISVRGEDTQGQTIGVLNTHLSTRGASSERRAAEHQVLLDEVEAWNSKTDALVGGGDLNTRDKEEIVAELRQLGYQVEGAKIDWLVTSGAKRAKLETDDAFAQDGTRLSDHPYVVGEYEFQ